MRLLEVEQKVNNFCDSHRRFFFTQTLPDELLGNGGVQYLQARHFRLDFHLGLHSHPNLRLTLQYNIHP